MMEHKPLAELQAVADVTIAEPAPPMTRQQRLERWIAVLEAEPTRRLCSLYEIEYLSPEERRQCRSNGSPLTVAYEDPVLRAQGLKSDRVGDCVGFFEITEHNVHHAFCSCHVGSVFTGKDAAARLRRLLPSSSPNKGVGQRLVQRLFSLLPAR
jgi:hypothetical protein